jgi:cation transport ATPase
VKISSVFVSAVVVIATGTGTTVINIKQNLFGAFFYNTISIPVTNADRLRWMKFVERK